ncbi:hypothetical protein [Sphingobacterium sp. MYb388]|uniref:hypothetical protein n=1 Tax=Sphingobacterium sp. MYb388 TaxID=2745437 RepID=UPI0030ADC0FF
MNYATPYHIGHFPITQRAKATGAIPTVGRIYPFLEAPQGCRGNKEGQKEVRTNRPVTDGFLSCKFLPKQEAGQAVQAYQGTERTERDFYNSLSHLAQHYNLHPMHSKSYGYPYNIALALDDIQQQLKDKVRNWEQLSFLQDSRGSYLETTECYSMGTTLLYIPVAPLFRLLKGPKCKHTAQLLLSVYAYLYHVAAVPYHGNENSYLYRTYEMLKDWVTDDEETEEGAELLQEIEQSVYIGEFIERKLYSHHNLDRFKHRLDNFKIKGDTDKACWDIANNFYQLLLQYPNETMFRSIPISIQDDDDDDDDFEEDDSERIIAMAKYISFCADSNGKLFEQLFESVNLEFQNCAGMQEPTISKRFDGNESAYKSLDFESLLFPLIEELICIVNDL